GHLRKIYKEGYLQGRSWAGGSRGPDPPSLDHDDPRDSCKSVELSGWGGGGRGAKVASQAMCQCSILFMLQVNHLLHAIEMSLGPTCIFTDDTNFFRLH